MLILVIVLALVLVGPVLVNISGFLPERDYTLRSGIGYRFRLSSVLSSVMFVRPKLTHGVETFGNISFPFCTLAILSPSYKILRRSSQGTPSSEALKQEGQVHHVCGATW